MKTAEPLNPRSIRQQNDVGACLDGEHGALHRRHLNAEANVLGRFAGRIHTAAPMPVARWRGGYLKRERLPVGIQDPVECERPRTKGVCGRCVPRCSTWSRRGRCWPAVERVVGVDRAQPAEGEPCARAELGRTELIGEDQSHEGREHQPEGGGQGISRKNARQRGVRRFRGAVPLYDGYGALPTVQSCLAGQPKQLQSRSALTQIKRRWNARPGSNAISNETRWRCVCLRMASASIRGVEHALTRGSGKYGKLRTSWRFTGREIDFQPAAQESWPPPPVQGIQACRIPLHDPSASRQAVEHFSAAPAR